MRSGFFPLEDTNTILRRSINGDQIDHPGYLDWISTTATIDGVPKVRLHSAFLSFQQEGFSYSVFQVVQEFSRFGPPCCQGSFFIFYSPTSQDSFSHLQFQGSLSYSVQPGVQGSFPHSISQAFEAASQMMNHGLYYILKILSSFLFSSS